MLSGQSLLNINGQSWLEIQHLQIDWFDGYGVQVQATTPATSDHIWLANVASNSMVENSTTPLGFYVHPNGTPTDIHLYNTDANMNYAGYLFDAGGGQECPPHTCSFEIKNCRAYGNRAYGIVDNVAGGVSYDYCQPGRMRLAEDRLTALERNDIKRNVYDRIVTAAIAFAVSALITLHDHFVPK